MNHEPDIHLLVELESEVIRWRRRTMFLLSVVIHGVFIAFLLLAPDLFRRGAEMMGLVVNQRPRDQATFLVMPPDLLKRLKEPPSSNILSDKDRRAQGRSPLVNPHGLRMPYIRGNTPLPEIAGGGKPVPPPPPPAPAPAPASPPATAKSSAPSTAQAAPPPPQEAKEEARLRLEDVAPPPSAKGSDSRLGLPTPGQAIQRSLEAAARGRGSGSVAGPDEGGGNSQFNNVNPNFSTEGPIILSDTKGFDFGPYLTRIVWVVKRNWYAVIPESARLGQKGRVAIVFEIRKDGSVPELRLVSSSGLEPLDRAALAGIHASVPFPPLPEAFTGEHLVLQFIFLYNLGYIP